MKKKFAIILLFLIFLCSLFILSCGQDSQDQTDTSNVVEQVVTPSKTTGIQSKENTDQIPPVEKLKAGFIYVGPVGDYGWSNAHDMGRQFAEQKFPWLETIIVESVKEADCARIIDRLIQQQECDVVFTTSFGYMEDTIAAGTRYPGKLFMHCAGFKRSDNVGTYFGDLYQIYYLNGIMAGALTKTDKVGYVAAIPIPELVRHINAFALGIKTANPNAKLNVKWLNAFYAPDKAREAAEALISEGCDALAFTEDTPSVIEVGQSHSEKGKQIYTFSHYSPMQPYGKDSVVSGQLMNWSGLYTQILEDIHNKTWTNKDIWWLAKENAAILGANATQIINPKFETNLKTAMINTKEFGSISAYDLVVKRYAQMKQGVDIFEPFTGPIKDNQGTLKIKEGEKASKDDLLKMMYYVDNVEGSIP